MKPASLLSLLGSKYMNFAFILVTPVLALTVYQTAMAERPQPETVLPGTFPEKPTTLLDAPSTTSDSLMTCSVDIAPASANESGMPGDTVSHSYLITNNGGQAGVVSVYTAASQNWPVTVNPSPPYALSSQTAQPITVSVTVPGDVTRAISGTVDNITITATLQCGTGTANDTSVLHATVRRKTGVHIEPDRSASLGDTVTFTHVVTNTGNWTDTINLVTHTLPSFIPATIEPLPPLTLGPGVAIPITVTTYRPPNHSVITVTAVSSSDNSKSDEVVDTVEGSVFCSYLPTLFQCPTPENCPPNILRDGCFQCCALRAWQPTETGDFADHPATVVSADDSENPFDSCAARLGNPAFRNGHIPMGRSTISQTVLISQPAKLSFTYYMCSYDVLTHEGKLYDSFEVALNDVTNCIYRDGNTTDSHFWCSGKRTRSINLSQYVGQTLTVYFSIWNREDRNFNTWAYVDQIIITP